MVFGLPELIVRQMSLVLLTASLSSASSVSLFWATRTMHCCAIKRLHINWTAWKVPAAHGLSVRLDTFALPSTMARQYNVEKQRRSLPFPSLTNTQLTLSKYGASSTSYAPHAHWPSCVETPFRLKPFLNNVPAPDHMLDLNSPQVA